LNALRTYKRPPEDEPSDSRHVEDIAKAKYQFNKDAFCWFMLYEHVAYEFIM